MHVSFPGNLDLSPEKAYLSRKKIYLKPQLQQLTPQNDFALGIVKKGCGGSGAGDTKYLMAGRRTMGVRPLALQPFPLLCSFFYLKSFEVASELWEAPFSLCFTALDKGSSPSDDTLVLDIHGFKELAIRVEVLLPPIDKVH